ncbi:FtsX-like permease family protein [Jiangella sp. DSM 45060]|uniref:FtsX-like permease family protein n=1 Tax=Jiangella sp. DSM 45060 TaxID=1798224 RepID=UPI00087A5574|nr:ABC transporter permease [Jiangella sp. DSM 45060]SDS36265.1 FtsX-like permease family protein [Jiangella sp. DSM 45060]
MPPPAEQGGTRARLRRRLSRLRSRSRSRSASVLSSGSDLPSRTSRLLAGSSRVLRRLRRRDGNGPAGVAPLVRAQLRAHWGRALALGLGVVAATSVFTVLTGASEIERLELRGEVAAAPSPYHILVRPPGTRSDLEAERGLVRPYQLSGQFGGISMSDYDAIRALGGVEVAAPVAMVGYVMKATQVAIDVGPRTDAGRELLVADVVYTSDRGLTRIEQPSASYSYVTPNTVAVVGQINAGGEPYGEAETMPDGSTVLVCPYRQYGDDIAESPAAAARERSRKCWTTRPGGDPATRTLQAPQRRTVMLEWSFPVLVAAVDPAQEAALGGDDVPASLRALAGPAPATGTGTGSLPVPVVVAAQPHVDAQAEVTVRRLPDDAAARFAEGLPLDEIDALLATPGPVVGTETVTADRAYEELIGQAAESPVDILVDSFWTTEPTRYDVGAGGVLRPRTVDNSEDAWRSSVRVEGYVPTPPLAADTGFRRVRPHPGSANAQTGDLLPHLGIVGVFQPSDFEAAGFDGAHGLPAADQRSTALLGDRNLLPSGSPAAYHLGPPTAFMRLSDLDTFTGSGIELADPEAPISAIRVQVAGVTGVSPVERERVRLVADQIRRATGLDVDIVLGSTATEQTVELPPGEHGRPALAVAETWMQQGVVAAVMQAVDHKSVALFVLALAVSTLFVANVSAASARSRRGELAVLSRIGWGRGMLLRLLLAEVLLVGGAAGVAGALVAVATGWITGLEVTLTRALVAVPVAVFVALVAAAWPAWRASKPSIAGMQQPRALPGQRPPVVRGVRSLAVANVVRSPGRTGLGVLSVALGCAALTALLGITLAFNGAVVGSVLGDAVSVRAREIDYVAVLVTILLSSVAVADVVFLNVRDRRAELAVLQAVGWGDGRVRRVVLAEAALIGCTGAVCGTVAGLAIAAGLAGELRAELLIAAATTVVGGTLVPILASLVPVAALRRMTVASTLTRDA